MDKLDKEIEEDQDENCLAYALNFKKRLRYDVGETVFLISDTNREVALTISKIEIFDKDFDYVCTYVHPKKRIILRDFFIDKILMK